ncbi:unnamed protein product [Rotaria sp. Silwood1]|nr:unnamed protein product [Rotaria sp. Silwood1]CAF0960798.1 unnamed protein product [Rotaria sp. Silwood1]CAF3371584.1 unnamed protein product [Rotaria sp. Silwood1]CAF4716306.1 unnamed protein product [Rotaria sp. Silwood1]
MNHEEMKLYHEKQKLQLCALHALNSLFQRKIFNKDMLDSIVHGYDKSLFWNEYSTFYTGNYDLRIIVDALKLQGYTIRIIASTESFNTINFKDCFGLLLNITVERPFFDRLPIVRSLTKPGRHWLTIKSIDGEQYYNFDSKLSRPKLIGNQNNLIDYLNTFDRAQTHIFLVIEEASVDEFEQQ